MTKKKTAKKVKIKLDGPTYEGNLEMLTNAAKKLNIVHHKVAGITAFVLDFDNPLIEGGLLQLIEEYYNLQFYIDLSPKAPKSTILLVLEYITRANYGLQIGNFEMDLDDGFIRFKNNLNFKGLNLNETLVVNLIKNALEEFNVYLPEMLNVMNNGDDPKIALEKVLGSKV